MYEVDSASLRAVRSGGRWSGIGRNVLFLGLTSMLTDVSSEMVTAILPLYLVVAVGLTPLQFGFIDGLSQGMAAIARLASGMMADRWHRHRDVAAAGYALSAVCKLGLLWAGTAWAPLATTMALDRIGKGIRTAPRDALISLSCARGRSGLAFGVHRALDTLGALLGPLLAFALLSALPQAFDLVFVTSFCIALIGVATLLSFVRDRPRALPVGGGARCGWAATLGLLRRPPFRAVLLAGTALSLTTVADSFFLLMLQRKAALDAAYFPLLYVAISLSYLALAIPAGRLGDRIGRRRVFVGGHVLLLLAGGCLLWPGDALATGLLALGLVGAYYACTDGVLMATASLTLPAAQRASGLALIATATGLARMLASLVFGALWQWRGIEFALAAFSLALAVTLLLAAAILRRQEGPAA